MKAEPTLDVLIVGGGPVGAMLAALLCEEGLCVEVIDKRSDPRDEDTQSGRSINLTMAERGLAALAAVGAREAVLEGSVPLYGRVVHPAGGAPCVFAPYGHAGEAIHALRRHELTALLVDVAERRGARFRFGTACQDLDLEAAKLRIKRADGEREERSASLIVAADGAYSTIRSRMQRRLRYFDFSQRYAHLEYAEFLLPAERDRSWGSQRNAVHIWPRGHYMLIGFPNLDGSLTLSMQLPREGAVSHRALRTVDDLVRLFREDFPDALDDVLPQLGEYFERPTGTMLTIRCSPWTMDGRVLLMGDAAHAVFPSYGQGCNASFEDCVTLRDLWREHGCWREATRAFEALRKPEADAIADLSIEHFDVLNRAVGDPEHQLATRIALELHRRRADLAPIYNNVSFTTMPFTEAIRRERELQEIVRQVRASLPERSLDEAVELVLARL